MMTSLRDITADHKELISLVEREEFSLDDVKDTLEAMEGEFNAKAQSLVAVINNFKVDMSIIDTEIKRLTDRKKVMVNKQDSLKEYLKTNMQASGITNIKCPLFSITLAKGRDVAVIDDEALIPEGYKEYVEVLKIDKAGILKALKEGPVDGARLDKSDESLRIK
jgi:hypothetical protein